MDQVVRSLPRVEGLVHGLVLTSTTFATASENGRGHEDDRRLRLRRLPRSAIALERRRYRFDRVVSRRAARRDWAAAAEAATGTLDSTMRRIREPPPIVTAQAHNMP